MRSILILVCALICIARVSAADGDLPASNGTPITAANDAALTTALSTSASGQHILLTGSSYSTARTLAAGKVVVNTDLASMPVITGAYTMSGADTIVHGLDFSGNGRVIISGSRAQVIRCKFHGQTTSSPITVTGGDDVVIARNEIYSWGVAGDCNARRGITVKAPRLSDDSDGAHRIRISYNYLHDQIGYNPESCATDGEAIALGQTGSGGRSQSQFAGWLHHNLIVDCAGDNEGISVKSSYNVIEFNHLAGLRGFNNRIGGFNEYRGNRVENTVGSGARFNRGGYQNLSLGEIIDKDMLVEGGDYSWDQTHEKYLRSDGSKIIGSDATGFDIGIDVNALWDLNAIGTVLEDLNISPTLGAEQSSTTNNWSGPPSMTVPAAITLTTADVGPLSGAGSSGGEVTITPSGTIEVGYSIVGETIDTAIVVTNTGASTVSGTVSVATPFSITAGATFTDLAVDADHNVTVRYSPSAAGQHTQTVTADVTGGADSTVDVRGVAVALQGGLTFAADAGTIIAPLTDNGTDISQSSNTPSGGGGIAAYGVTISPAGFYRLRVTVKAETTSTNSYFAAIDGEPSIATDVWDVIDFTSGFEERLVSIRGTGTFDAPEYPIAQWDLTEDTHIIIFRGREKDTFLQTIEVEPVPAAPSQPPPRGHAGATLTGPPF